MLTAGSRFRLDRLRVQRMAHEAEMIETHSGIAGLLYVLAAAHGARVTNLDTTLGKRAARVLTAGTAVTPCRRVPPEQAASATPALHTARRE